MDLNLKNYRIMTYNYRFPQLKFYSYTLIPLSFECQWLNTQKTVFLIWVSNMRALSYEPGEFTMNRIHCSFDWLFGRLLQSSGVPSMCSQMLSGNLQLSDACLINGQFRPSSGLEEESFCNYCLTVTQFPRLETPWLNLFLT